MNCRSTRLKRFIDLGDQPNGNYFPSADELDSEPNYPCAMAVCEDCWQVQIEEFPSVESMFTNHPYVTGINIPVVEHFEQMAARTVKKFAIPKNSLAIDIGANDGTLMQCFQKNGLRVMGVDPGKKTGRLAAEKGLHVFEAFWNDETAKLLQQLNVRPKLISATAVFYHIEDIHSFVKGISRMLEKDTIFLVQCVYMKDVLEHVQFDHFYHEHTMMHSLRPLKRLFSEHGMRMIDVDFYPIHGGSFVLYVGREDSVYPSSDKIAAAIEAEEAAGMYQYDTYEAFARRVEHNKNELLKLLKRLKAEGKSVYALGAPLKGSTLLNYCGIGPDLVACATEVNRFKIGKYTPGTHIPIIYEEAVEEEPDYYLVLSWNFIEFFEKKYASFLNAGGKMIVPHPEVRVIERSPMQA